MEIIHAFVTPIFKLPLTGMIEKLQPKLDQIIEETAVDLRVNQKPYLHADEDFKPLVDTVMAVVKDISENVFDVKKNKYDVDVTSMWINVGTKYAEHAAHIHNNSWLSGIFVIRGGEDKPAVNFLRPSPLQILPTIEQYNAYNSNILHCPAEVGTLYLFPSYLYHYVLKNLSDEKRVTISFDTLLRGEYYEDTKYSPDIGRFTI